jgi:hypothetical protein
VTVIPDTGITWPDIVIISVPNTLDPSLAVARAVTVPFDMAVTRPDVLIEACPVPLEIVQVTVLFVAFDGVTAALSCNVPPIVPIVVAPPAPVTVIPDTGTTWPDIVIISVPETPDPSLAVALAVTVPFDMAVTRPDVLIEACPVPLEIVQVTVLFVAFDGVTAALNCKVPPSVPIVVAPPAPVTVIPDTGITWPDIVIISVPNTLDPSLAVALAVTVPFDMAVTMPDVLIEACPVPLEIVQVTVLFVAFDGVTAALNCKVPPSVPIVVAPPAPVTVIPETGIT